MARPSMITFLLVLAVVYTGADAVSQGLSVFLVPNSPSSLTPPSASEPSASPTLPSAPAQPAASPPPSSAPSEPVVSLPPSSVPPEPAGSPPLPSASPPEPATSPPPSSVPAPPSWSALPPSIAPSLSDIPPIAPAPPLRRAIKAGYWPSDLSTTFPTSAIDSAYFTHIYYAFLLPNQSTYELVVTPSDDQNLAAFAATLHGKNPPLKAMLSIGGGGSNATIFALMASAASTRAAFINSTIAIARKYDLDGLDLDWEFPSNQKEMDDLGILFREWRAALAEESSATGRGRLLLTSAVYFAFRRFLDQNQTYPAQSIKHNVDWVNVMCFDYHGSSWDPSTTGAHASLYDPNSNISTSYGIQSWIDSGIPTKKVVMGLPVYGRTWQLKDPAIHGIGAPADGEGPGDGVLHYNDLVDYNVQNNATVVYDEVTVSAYSYAGTSWIGYDNPRSVKTKIEWAKGQKRLGGYFFWAIGFDKNWTISKQASDSWDD